MEKKNSGSERASIVYGLNDISKQIKKVGFIQANKSYQAMFSIDIADILANYAKLLEGVQ